MLHVYDLYLGDPGILQRSSSIKLKLQQRFAPSIGNIEKAMWVSNFLGRLASIENFCNFAAVSYFWGCLMDKKVWN